MAGPIFFAILQLSVERGSRAGITVAAGQWVGDLVYIALVFWGATYIEDIIDAPAAKQDFIRYLGTAGGVLLTVFGVVMFCSKAQVPDEVQKISATSYTGYFLKGFLINTINPFPIFFWTTMMSTTITNENTLGETSTLFGTIMAVIIITDILKVYLSRRIRDWIKPSYLLYIRRIAGVALMISGLVLLIRAWVLGV